MPENPVNREILSVLPPIQHGERENLIFMAQGDLPQDGKKPMLRSLRIFLSQGRYGTGILTEKCPIQKRFVNWQEVKSRE